LSPLAPGSMVLHSFLHVVTGHSVLCCCCCVTVWF